MQVSIKNNDDGSYEIQAHLAHGLRLKMEIVPAESPQLAPDVAVTQLLGAGAIRGLCRRAELVPAAN